MDFTDAVERALALLRNVPSPERERVIVERAMPMLLEAGSEEAFLAWCAQHPEHRLDLAEAQQTVCAKPYELAAQVLRVIAEARLG